MRKIPSALPEAGAQRSGALKRKPQGLKSESFGAFTARLRQAVLSHVDSRNSPELSRENALVLHFMAQIFSGSFDFAPLRKEQDTFRWRCAQDDTALGHILPLTLIRNHRALAP
jgi:hypothetical protein